MLAGAVQVWALESDDWESNEFNMSMQNEKYPGCPKRCHKFQGKNSSCYSC